MSGEGAQHLANEIAARLRIAGSEQRAVGEKAYLKSDLDFFGVTVWETRRVVREALQARPELDRAALLALVEALWREPVHELRMAAYEALDARGPLLVAEDLALVERLLRESKTWALVDGLAEHVAGGLVERFLALNATLDRWAADEDFWLRRSALLALQRPLQRGAGDFDRFARYAEAMLEEREFFIRKAIGWVLREASKKRPRLVAAWLAPRTHRLSGVTMREAVKYSPPPSARRCSPPSRRSARCNRRKREVHRNRGVGPGALTWL
jgi:3-methyladenine DNA glycosylase AlkD